MGSRLSLIAVFASLLVVLGVTPANAVEPSQYVAFGSYQDEFLAYWRGKAHEQNSIVWSVLLTGTMAMMIILSGSRKVK